MFDGTTLIVDVLTLGENSYALSLPAEDLWVAYEVVRRHVDANGVRHYSQMTEAKTTADGYSFKFDTGDTFTCSSHLDKPTSSTLSDEGGSGGGVLVVGATIDGNTMTLDKTWQQIADADFAILKGQTESTHIETLSGYGTAEGIYWVHFGGPDGALPDFNASSADGYPSATLG